MKTIILLLALLMLLSGCTQKLQVCPDEWYDNQMPRPIGEVRQTQHFVIDGERVAPSKVDVEWVKNNCNITMKVVS